MITLLGSVECDTHSGPTADVRPITPSQGASCDGCVVREQAICAALSPSDQRILGATGRQRSLQPGEALIWEGSDSVLVGNVVDGVLTLSTGTADGREQIVGVVYPSDFIGRPFGGATRHTVIALTEARVCIFARSDFDRFAADHPALEQMLLQRTLTELDRTRRWLLLLGRKTAEERIASFLLEVSERLSAPSSNEPSSLLNSFDLPFSRQQIADVLGLTIETVSRQFTRLRKLGVIKLPSRRGVTIEDRAALVRLAA